MTLHCHAVRMPRLARAARAAAGALTFTAIFTACSIASEGSPRDIPVQYQDALLESAERAAGAATGTARIYLLSSDPSTQATIVIAVPRDVAEAPLALLDALLAGPNEDELDAQFRTAIPDDVVVRSAQLRGGTLVVDLSGRLLQLSGDTLIRAIAQIVFTASEVSGVRAVKLLVDGADQQWPTGRGALQSAPLTPYDYPGLLASAQPAYPAVPSPT